jgi:hypothetical protein
MIDANGVTKELYNHENEKKNNNKTLVHSILSITEVTKSLCCPF